MLTMQQQASVLDEEARAWRNASAVLEEAGFVEWEAFECRKEAALSTYRRGFTKLSG
jgi:hypothetical protein